MKLVFMGTPDFASGILSALADSGHEVAAVVTRPDKPVGRSGALRPTPVKEEALSRGIPVMQPARVRDPEVAEKLRETAPDAIVVAAFGQIIPAEIISLPRFGCINVHASLLPKYRGAAPIQWALLDGETETGVTIMQMDEGLDTGDILAVRKVEIAGDETGGSLFDKLAQTGAELLISTLGELEAGSIVPVPQPEESPTEYARMITKEDGRIDWTRDAAAIERQVRALTPWPSAFTSLGGKVCKIWKARAVSSGKTKTPSGDKIETGVPGSVTATGSGGIAVAAGSGTLIVEELQIEGKKRMKSSDYLRGHSLKEGEHFG